MPAAEQLVVLLLPMVTALLHTPPPFDTQDCAVVKHCVQTRSIQLKLPLHISLEYGKSVETSTICSATCSQLKL